MRITVEFYGMLRPLAGSERISLDLPGTTVADALDELCRKQPGLATHMPRIACAIGSDLVQRRHPLEDGNVLALIPPVSGGAG